MVCITHIDVLMQRIYLTPLLTHWSFGYINISWWLHWVYTYCLHYNDVIMTAMASQITSVSIVCSIVCSGADQRKHQSFASLTFARGIHRWPVDSPHKGPVTRKMFPFDDVIMYIRQCCLFDAGTREGTLEDMGKVSQCNRVHISWDNVYIYIYIRCRINHQFGIMRNIQLIVVLASYKTLTTCEHRIQQHAMYHCVCFHKNRSHGRPKAWCVRVSINRLIIYRKA